MFRRELKSNVRLVCCISQSDALKSSQPKQIDVIELVFTSALFLVAGIVLRRRSDRNWLCHVVLLYAPVSQRHDLRANNHHGRGKLHVVSDVIGHGCGPHW